MKAVWQCVAEARVDIAGETAGTFGVGSLALLCPDRAGVFAADMQMHLINDGPVTSLLYF